MPYGDTVTIKGPLPADVVSANVLMQDQGAKLSSEQLQFVETREFQGDSFSIFNGGNLKKDQGLTLKLTDLDKLTLPVGRLRLEQSPSQGVDQNLLRWIVIGLGGVMVVFVALGYPYFRSQLTHQPHAFH